MVTPERIVFFRDWLQYIRHYGPSAITGYPFDFVRVRRAERNEAFDAHFGTDTASTAFPWNLPSVEKQNWSEVYGYEAIPAWLIREILGSIPLRPGIFTFVDMGAGKGRALLVASEFPFAKIVGVELSRELHAIAQKNVKRFRSEAQKCKNFCLLCMNALDYKFEPQPLVLFLFNPFGRETLQIILENLRASLRSTPRDIFVVYVNPTFNTLARSASYLERLKKHGSWWRNWTRYEIYAASSEQGRATVTASQDA
jgi:predicted RNA methylase